MYLTTHIGKYDFLNPFKSEFVIVILIHYKPRIFSRWRWLEVGGKLKKIVMYW